MCRELERKRLARLAQKAKDYCNNTDCGYCGLGKFGGFPGCQQKRLADIILADGWIRPPCDSVWFIVDKNTKYAMAMPRKIDELPLYMLKDLEKYGYYETKEEAEKHL